MFPALTAPDHEATTSWEEGILSPLDGCSWTPVSLVLAVVEQSGGEAGEPWVGTQGPQLYLQPTRQPPGHRVLISKLQDLVSAIPKHEHVTSRWALFSDARLVIPFVAPRFPRGLAGLPVGRNET